MTADVGIDVVLRGQTDGGRVVKRTLDDIEKSADKATGGVSKLDKQMRATSGAADLLKRSMGGVVAALGVRDLLRMADSVTMIQGRLQNATRSAAEAQQAFDGLRGIVQRTGSDMETVVSVFQRLSFVRDEINATTAEMLQFTDTVSKLGVISGAGTQAMRAGLTQLGQALSSNIVRAEEWSSIMENIPAVGVQIAKQFGVTTGQLRQLIIEGEVLSEDVFAAMVNSASEVESQFERMPMTVGRAFAALRSDFELFIGQTSETSNTTNVLVGMIDTLRLAIHGLGVGLNAVVTIIASAGVSALKHIENLINGAINGANWMRTQANKILPDSMELSLMDNVSLTGGMSLNDLSNAAKDDLQKILNSSTPQNTVFDRMTGNSGATASASIRQIEKDYASLASTMNGEGKEATKALEKQHNALESAIKASRTEEERLIDKINELEGLRGIAHAKDQTKDLETAIARANVELDELRIQAERNGPVAKAFESLAGQIDDGFRDAFRNAFTQSDGGWRALLDGWKATFRTFLADLAYMALARPIVLSLVGGVGGVMGISSGAQASILGDIGGTGMGGLFGGGGLLGNIGSIGSSFLNGGLYSNTLGGIGQGLGNILTGNAWGYMGPFAPGSAQGLLAGGLGNAGYGAIGALAANLFGLGGGIGGTVGGALGSVAGGAVGSSMGTILGLAGGPIGAIAGGFLGSALGGMFGGGKPSDKAQFGGLNLATLSQFGVGGQSGSKYSAENEKFRDSVLKEAANLAQILKDAGATMSGRLYVHVGNRDGLRVGDTYKTNYRNFGNDADAFINEVMRRVVRGASGLEDTFATILKKVGYKNTQALAEAFEFGKFYESIINPADSVAEAMKAVNEQFDGLIKQARSLGLMSVKFTEEMEKQRQAQLDLIKAQQAGFQSLEAMKATFDSWLYDQSISGTSSLSPLEKLLAAQGNFGSVLSAIQGGDVGRTQELLQAGQQLLQLGQAMYASSVEFAGLERFVRDSITSVAQQLNVPGYAGGTMSARPGWAWVGENGPELRYFRGGERVHNAEESKAMARGQSSDDARFVEMNTRLASMDQAMARMERQISRLVNKLTVIDGR